MKTPVKAVAAVLGIWFCFSALAVGCEEIQAGVSTRQVLVPQVGVVLTVGDVVFVDSATRQVVRVPARHVRGKMEAGTELFLVTKRHGVSYSVTPVVASPESDGAETKTGVCLREILIAPVVVDLRVGDVVLLDEATSKMVPVPLGHVQGEVEAGTELFLVTERLEGCYSVLVIRTEVGAEGKEPAGQVTLDVGKHEPGEAGRRDGELPDGSLDAFRVLPKVAFTK